MHLLTIRFIGLLALTLPLQAGFELPHGVFSYPQLKEARVAAKERDQHLVFVWTDKDSPSGKVAKASLDTMNALKDAGVVIYVDAHHDDLHRLIREALQAPQAGTYIPKTVILDEPMERKLMVIPYREGRRHLVSLENGRKLLAYKGSYVPKSADPLLGGKGKDKPRSWTNNSGKTVNATFMKRDGNQIILQNADGKQVAIPFLNLSFHDQQWIKLNAP